jgi:hypothetical protein
MLAFGQNFIKLGPKEGDKAYKIRYLINSIPCHKVRS